MGFYRYTCNTKLINSKYMKPTYASKLCSLVLFFSISISAQTVGINTKTAEGILDVSSGIHGIVLPRIALTGTNVAAPVLNPQGGGLAVGTVVYNTNATATGSDDVYPGVYVWSGTEWVNKFTKKHAAFFTQSSFFQPASNAGYENIPGLNNQSFVANYTGVYKVEISVNFGAGYIKNASAGTDVAAQEGIFRFTFDGTDYFMPLKTYGTHIDGAGGTTYYAIWEQFSIVDYLNLTAGVSYNFDLDFDQFDSPGFVNNGNSGTGKGYIGIPDHVPCSVEFIYIGD